MPLLFSNGLNRHSYKYMTWLFYKQKPCGVSQLSAGIDPDGERSGSVVECLTGDRRVASSSLTGGTTLCP